MIKEIKKNLIVNSFLEKLKIYNTSSDNQIYLLDGSEIISIYYGFKTCFIHNTRFNDNIMLSDTIINLSNEEMIKIITQKFKLENFDMFLI